MDEEGVGEDEPPPAPPHPIWRQLKATTASSDPARETRRKTSLRSFLCVLPSNSTPSGNKAITICVSVPLGTSSACPGPVVFTVTVNPCADPLERSSCTGETVQVAFAGAPEQARLTGPGIAVVGVRFSLYTAVAPA